MAHSQSVSFQKHTVSMADVARTAGVSQQTVSRVANGSANVSDATRKKVQAVMDSLGFRPNFAGRSLRSGLYQSVGLCLYDIREFGNLATLDGIVGAARDHQYAITMIEKGPDDGLCLNDITQRMSELPVDGMIVSMSLMASDFESFVPRPGLGTVLLSMYEHPRCTTVDSDQYGCSTLVMDYLYQQGHRKIRFVAGPTYSIDSQFREKGWRDSMAKYGLEAIEPYVGNWTANSGYEIGRELLKNRDFTAVYAANDQMALGIIAAFEEAGVHVPDDVSIVGVDDSLEDYLPNFSLTTVRFNLLERGRVALEHAIKASQPGYTPRAIRIPPELIVRSTVVPLRTS
ncbi:MAG: LacI family DNA-binding transcriptional regulator [Atopobiaceae bacterium]|nr:LacI family DNA-binding transcriptional regulator [Atopobiaceae bacterium]